MGKARTKCKASSGPGLSEVMMNIYRFLGKSSDVCVVFEGARDRAR